VPTGTLDTRYAARWIQFFVEQAKKNILAAQTVTEPLASYFDQLAQIYRLFVICVLNHQKVKLCAFPISG
jgi:hypothetical protein